MNKRLSEWLDAIDFKSIFSTIIILVVIASLLYLCTYLDEDHDEQYLAGQSSGFIISIEPVDMMHQGKYGTKIYTDSYKIGDNWYPPIDGVILNVSPSTMTIGYACMDSTRAFDFVQKKRKLKIDNKLFGKIHFFSKDSLVVDFD